MRKNGVNVRKSVRRQVEAACRTHGALGVCKAIAALEGWSYVEQPGYIPRFEGAEWSPADETDWLLRDLDLDGDPGEPVTEEEMRVGFAVAYFDEYEDPKPLSAVLLALAAVG